MLIPTFILASFLPQPLVLRRDTTTRDTTETQHRYALCPGRQRMRNKRILVTGGAGFVGSTLCLMLLEEGCLVRVLDCLRWGDQGIRPCLGRPNFEFMHGDIRSGTDVVRALRGVDFICHLAACVGVPLCKRSPKEAVAVNQGGTFLLNRLRGGAPMAYASTGSVYGAVPGICMEDTPPQPLSLYGQTKLMAEQEVLRRGNSIALRFATGCGVSPRMRWDLLLNHLCRAAMVDGHFLMYEPKARRTFIHVKDMARAFIHAIRNFQSMKDNVYNTGNEGLNVTKEQVGRLIQKHVHYELEFDEHGQDPDRRDYRVSYSKIRRTGFRTSVGLEHVILEVLDFISELRSQQTAVLSAHGQPRE